MGNEFIGINIGSVTVNIVKLSNGDPKIKKRAHLGKPAETLNDLMDEIRTSDNRSRVKENEDEKKQFYGISGSFGSISEISAIERGIKELDQGIDAVISLGGESFLLYLLEDNLVKNVISHDKCAAGSGEFFVQQSGRLNLTLEEAIEKARRGNIVSLASRCSVHCKSDITHKLNRGETSIEDVLYSLIDSMVSKVITLIYQSKIKVKKLLLIGGVALNEVFVEIIKDRMKESEVIVDKMSPVFEAYGSALLTEDKPKEKEVKLLTHSSFSRLSSLKLYKSLVTIIEEETINKEIGKGPFVLGVDVGSTTTKTVLVNPEDNSVIASYYGRTNGNPVKATKECINELIRKVGNVTVNLTGITGSGRQIVGAYLGTDAIFNEISAHARGAAFYDEEVDTIFEIGGQDAKFMLLQNKVPIDYAMNAACSAGTGSFLEESAKSDLGITVFEISDIALQADSPVKFKADCAAFINSDIRSALLEGYERDDIVGGLVYSIVDNYLNKVKGSRPVGRKIFFQGGVAKNFAVGYAFAQATGKEIVIPPNPELVGAFGIALLSIDKRAENQIHSSVEISLEALATNEMKALKSFTCKACSNYCTIERYMVGGRKFPFGGSCSKYEHQWKGSIKIDEADDLVSIRNDLIFGEQPLQPNEAKSGTIGIPRALLTHSLFPLFAKFFKELGFQVILSGIDDEKDMITNAPFCYPVQIAHGAVLDLVKKGVEHIFVPHVNLLPKEKEWKDSTICPVAQSNPYYISGIFPEIVFLSPVLDFSEGYEKSESLIDIVVKEFQISPDFAKEAYLKAVKAQQEVENEFLRLGKEALAKLEDSDFGVLLVGRSYNAFPPETSQSIAKKLTSRGVPVIPFDFIPVGGEGDFSWFFSNYVQFAVNLVKKNKKLFLLYINSFSCTIDAFTQSFVRSEMVSKPYLIMEIDAHTGDAGTQTRLEAFVEIIKNYKITAIEAEKNPFQRCRVAVEGREVMGKELMSKAVIITSKGERVDVRDPRVKVFFPSFSQYHTDAISKSFELFGYNVGESSDIIFDYPVKGLRYSSGKECIPLPISVGHLMTIVEERQPGDIIGYFMLNGGSPCAVDAFFMYLEKFIEDQELEDVFIFDFDPENKFFGIRALDLIRFLPKMIVLGDIMDEMESALLVVGEEGSVYHLKALWKRLLTVITDKSELNKGLAELIASINRIKRKSSPKDHPKILLSGDFFVRFSEFFVKDLKEIYAAQGVIVKSADLYELFLYIYYNRVLLIAQGWDSKPNEFSTALKAITRLWAPEGRSYLAHALGVKYLEKLEFELREMFNETGLIFSGPTDIKSVVDHSIPLINPLIFGEAIPTIGKGMKIIKSDIDGIILVGPQNCLPHKISQAILKPIYMEKKIPLLVYDVDISGLSQSMIRLIEANIQQIKRKHQQKLISEKMVSEEHSGKLLS
ncbi:MAG: acyl-CoA dehydratase activase [Candidatus Kariarchaeaceae archaeon]